MPKFVLLICNWVGCEKKSTRNPVEPSWCPIDGGMNAQFSIEKKEGEGGRRHGGGEGGGGWTGCTVRSDPGFQHKISLWPPKD